MINEQVVSTSSTKNCSLKTEQNHSANVNVITIDNKQSSVRRNEHSQTFIGEFDPGSGRTLAACLIHASRAELRELALKDLAADG